MLRVMVFAAALGNGYSTLMAGHVTLEIPADVLESTRMTKADLKLELAISLFAAQRLSMGKAAELVGLLVSEFQRHLGSRHLGPHYDAADAQQDREALAAMRMK